MHQNWKLRKFRSGFRPAIFRICFSYGLGNIDFTSVTVFSFNKNCNTPSHFSWYILGETIPSFPQSLLQSESRREFFVIIIILYNMNLDAGYPWPTSQVDSLWNRGWSELENGLLKKKAIRMVCEQIPVAPSFCVWLKPSSHETWNEKGRKKRLFW